MTDTMPPKVAAAIAAVMGEVPKLEKGETNTHGRYNFASIDDFLEAVRPLCAKHGLIIMQDEDSFEVRESGDEKKPTVWLLMRFRYTLAHSSGEVWAHSPARSIMVNGAMGSQAFGAAQSYSLKQFMRSLFQIATGEKDADADAHPQSDLPRGASTRRASATRGNGNAAPEPTIEGDSLIDEIRACEGLPELEHWGKAASGPINKLPEHERDRVRKAYAAQLGALKKAA